MRYFVHHELKAIWAQPGPDPDPNDGLVGECDEARFHQYRREGFSNWSGRQEALAQVIHAYHYPPLIEDPDPWT
jgi:hypothetical protein